MKIQNINSTETIAKAREMLQNSPNVPAEFMTIFSVLLTLVEILATQVTKNSKNSSIPPSQDPNRKKALGTEGKRKPGGQIGRIGKNLVPIETPDEIIPVLVDRKALPKGHHYENAGIVKRQVVEIVMRRFVKEYQFEVLRDEAGKEYIAKEFKDISRPIQYGKTVKVTSVYMNNFQLIPYGRVEDYFRDQVGIPISAGSLYNFNEEAFVRLEKFEEIAKERLKQSLFLHADETGINVGGKRIWLHTASNDLWTLFMAHGKRGVEGMKTMDILPHYKGVLIHDHWNSYFTFEQCAHSLCNAHHLRELQGVIEEKPNHTWAKDMQNFLLEINKEVQEGGGVLEEKVVKERLLRYREIVERGDKECPYVPSKEGKKRGRIKKTKERNLLERLRNFETETLRFMTLKYVPFTNNQGENDIRMTKVQQKISGCFKSFEGAKIFCRIRSYLLTAQKHGLTPTEALATLFQGNLPSFCHSG